MVKLIFQAFKNTVSSFISKDPMTYGACIAFYTIISLPAISILITILLGGIYESGNIQDALLIQLQKYVGQSSAEQVDKILENADMIKGKWWARIIGISTLIFSATTVFISLQNALNYIWNLKPKKHSSLKSIFRYLVNRLLSFAVVISFAFILLVSLVVDSFLLIVKKFVIDIFDEGGVVLILVLNILFTLGIISVIFMLIFRYLPDARIKWRLVSIGGFFTAILFLAGKYLLGLYLNYTDIGSVYGAGGSLVLFLTWVYYSSIIVLFGSTFTYELAKLKDDAIHANPYATFYKEVPVKLFSESDSESEAYSKTIDENDRNS